MPHVLHHFQVWHLATYGPVSVCPGHEVGEVCVKGAGITKPSVTQALVL